MHQRQLIRDAVIAALTDETVAQDRVYGSRMAPLRKGGLPAIIVYTVREVVDPASRTTAPRVLDRRMQLAVEAALKAGEDVDDALDAFAEQIEKALDLDPTLENKTSDLILASTEIEMFDEQSERIGAIKLVYDVNYFTNAPDSDDVTLEPFETADVKTNLGNAQEDENQAHDTVELPQ